MRVTVTMIAGAGARRRRACRLGVDVDSVSSVGLMPFRGGGAVGSARRSGAGFGTASDTIGITAAS
jgi:hypothetical protein